MSQRYTVPSSQMRILSAALIGVGSNVNLLAPSLTYTDTNNDGENDV